MATAYAAILAQTAGHSDSLWRLMLYFAALLVILVAAAVIVGVARRKLLESNEGRTALPWTLEQLRDLRATGQISAEEFDRMKAVVITAMRRQMAGTSHNASHRVRQGSADGASRD